MSYGPRHDGQIPPRRPSKRSHQGRWHPFQLAFFLLNLSGLIDPTSEDREIGDLLWFPTGGGKTEAYLGLAAFTMALRRRRSRAGMRTDAGLAVLMRYTLRLLTLQQFQRASTLLCACEVLRADEPETWGDTRFTIGLWLGRKGTPNRHDDARRSLTRLQLDPAERGANPCQLESCPWCGETITPADYWTEGAALRTRVACPRDGCAFSKGKRGDGIPVLVVDEEIYRECPSMLLATVDKFAQMPWNGDVQALFGFVNRECDTCGFLTAATEHTGHSGAPGPRQTERLAPPDLIIQDELHLISGPLGTLVGLYETAVDFLCTWQKNGKAIRPKVIASTATVRRAFEQVQALFSRRLKVFPPPGLEPEDSFFAIEQPVDDEVSGRLYLGVCAPGKSMKTAYVRVAASLLSSVEGLVDTPELAEPYKTLVSYFNSLRELGGAIRLLDDDIPGRLYQLTDRGLPKRARPVYRELTSRIRQEDIPNLLRQLEQRHDAPRTDEDPLPLDAVLASNMISVGVDIDRLGLMVVVGQPKTTAEYIQATSRVGRQVWGPGLVVTLYNWSRPRDLSHYERFRHYHSTLYRNVEAVSATPFSTRALDRGLRGAFVAMARLGSEGWSPELGAGRFDPKHPRVTSVMAAFRQRAEVVAGSTIAAGLAQALSGVADEWWGFRTPLYGMAGGLQTRKTIRMRTYCCVCRRAGESGTGQRPSHCEKWRSSRLSECWVCVAGNTGKKPPPLFGELRPSQIITSFGPGSVVDLENISVVMAGTDYWSVGESQEIDEPRLRSLLRVGRFYRPPVRSDGAGSGVPAFLFPTYLRCPRCRRLGRYDRPDLFRLDGRRFRCKGQHDARVRRGGPLVFPARFVVACSNGHLDDFPWFRYVHRGKESPGCEPERLTFTESPKSAAVSALRVNCSVCPATRTMEDAFGQRAANALGECLGSRPWLQSADVPACGSPLRTTLRGASNLYFGLTHTALSIPEWDDPVHLAIAHHEEQLGLVDTLEKLRMGIAGGFLPRLERFEPERVLEAIKRRREQEEKQPTPLDIRREEYVALRSIPDPKRAAESEFQTEHVAVPQAFSNVIERVVIVRRLREVRALGGFTRIDNSADLMVDEDDQQRFEVQSLSTTELHWRPAVELRGEGVFIELAEEGRAVLGRVGPRAGAVHRDATRA